MRIRFVNFTFDALPVFVSQFREVEGVDSKFEMRWHLEYSLANALFK